MKTVVCYKCVANNESISVAPDRTLDMSEAQWEIGQYDLRAIEAGMQLKSSRGGEVIALTAVGDIAANTKMKKAVLSRGPDEMLGIQDNSLDTADEAAVAKVLAEAIKSLPDADLALFGEGSGDMYSQQMGNIVGGILGWNTLNAVCSIECGEDGLTVRRASDDGIETLTVKLPAVISVTGDINVPRIPTMKDILSAGKKPSKLISLDELAITPDAHIVTDSILAPEKAERKRVILSGDSEDIVEEFAANLRKAL